MSRHTLYRPPVVGALALAALVHAGPALAFFAPVPAGTAVEYYHRGFDHYFVTQIADEIAALDEGRIAGWTRTGRGFAVFASAAGGANPVCRFYIPPQHGNSHFYSASPAECAIVLDRIGTDPNFSGYILEAPDVFHAVLPDTVTGACPAGMSAGVPVVERARRLQPPLHRRSRHQGRDAGEGLHRRRLRPAPREHVHAGRGARRRGDGRVGRHAVRRELRRRPRQRRRLRRCGGRAVPRGEPGEPEQPRRGVATGPLVQRRRARPRGRVLVRRRRHLDARHRAVLALLGRQRRQRRRLGARDRPVGLVRARRHRALDGARAQQRAQRRQRDARLALDRRRAHVERAGDAASRRRLELQRQERDHRGPDRRALRVRGVGSPERQRRADLARADQRRRPDLGAGARDLLSRAATARRSTTRSSCCPTARWCCTSPSWPPSATPACCCGSCARPTRARPGRRRSRSRRSRAWAPSTSASGTAIRDGSILASIAAGTDGTLALAWQDARFSTGHDAIAFARSIDGGLTWSAPVRVNGDPSVPAFLPAVAIRDDGTIGVAYHDFRANTPDPATLPTLHWLATSSDGVTWTERVIGGPFDYALAPRAGDRLFLGDYMALVPVGTSFVALSAPTTADPASASDVTAALVPGPAPAASLAASAVKSSAATGRDFPGTRRSRRRARAAGARGAAARARVAALADSRARLPFPLTAMAVPRAGPCAGRRR